jgi:hypothetical protein
VDGNGTAHTSAICHSVTADRSGKLAVYQPWVTDFTLPPGATTAGEIILDQNSMEDPSADPLNWDECSWTSEGYSLPGQTTILFGWGEQDVAAMAVRPSGEIDLAFWNFSYSSLVLFSLPLGSSSWNFNGIVAFPNQ